MLGLHPKYGEPTNKTMFTWWNSFHKYWGWCFSTPFFSCLFTYLWSSCLGLLPKKWSSELSLNSHLETLGCPKEILWQEETTLPLTTKETVIMTQELLTALNQTAAPRVPFEKVQSPHRYLCSFSRAPSSRSPVDLSSLFFWIYFVKCTVSPCCIFSLSHSVLGRTRSSLISTKKQNQNKTQF